MTDLARQRFEEACTHDRAGREAEAIPCYEEALELGLPEPLRRRALVGLGSSYRNELRHREAIATLEGAVADYPEDAALRVFLALALRSGGHERAAFALLGEVAVEHADLGGYERAASYYLRHLD